MSKSKGLRKMSPEKPDPWSKVEVKRGRLMGGMLTDELMKAVFPANNVPQNKNGLEVVRVRVQGQRIPVRSSR